MEKAEAAEFLGVSVRTLERLAAAGRLKKGRALRKTRPVVTYEQTDLERLRDELERGRPAEVFRRLNTSKPTSAIGFRLDPFYVKQLEQEGAKHGMSAGEYARRLVIRGMEGQTAEGDIRELRETLADMFYVILVTRLGSSEAEAAEIIKSLSGVR